jgi:hypothetical protein
MVVCIALSLLTTLCLRQLTTFFQHREQCASILAREAYAQNNRSWVENTGSLDVPHFSDAFIDEEPAERGLLADHVDVEREDAYARVDEGERAGAGEGVQRESTRRAVQQAVSRRRGRGKVASPQANNPFQQRAA